MTTLLYRNCPRCNGESTFREGHLACVRCGLQYATNGTPDKDKWLLPVDERLTFFEVWEQFGRPVIPGVEGDLADVLKRAQTKQTVLAIVNWFKNVGEENV